MHGTAQLNHLCMMASLTAELQPLLYCCLLLLLFFTLQLWRCQHHWISTLQVQTSAH